MMATSRAHPPYTKAVVLSGKTSPACGRHTGGNLERSTRSSAIALIHIKNKIGKVYQVSRVRCHVNGLRSFGGQ